MTSLAPASFSPGAANAGMQTLDALRTHAHTRPNSAALVELSESGHPAQLTYGQLWSLTRALAQTIESIAAPGDLLILHSASPAHLLPWLFAALAAGARILPIGHQTPPAELRTLIRRTSAAVIITDAALELDIPTIPASLASRPPSAHSALTRAPGAIVLQTSGTTGLPNLALREAPALDADARAVASALSLTPDDRILFAPPLCHSYGIDILLGSVLAGSTLCTPRGLPTPALAAHLAAHTTVFPAVPFMLEALAREAPAAKPNSLRLAFTAGTQLPASVGEAFTDRWQTPVGQLYGATELGTVTFSHPSHPRFDPASVGIALQDVSLRTIDHQLAIRAPSMLSRYLDTPAPITDGHFLTGDLGHLDDAGRLHITGRVKLLIDVGGLKVNPLEIESTLAQHPAIRECAVAPVHLSPTVTRLRAYYVPRETPAPDADLRAFLKDRLSPHKIPRTFHALPALPRTPTGKLDRQALASLPS